MCLLASTRAFASAIEPHGRLGSVPAYQSTPHPEANLAFISVRSIKYYASPHALLPLSPHLVVRIASMQQVYVAPSALGLDHDDTDRLSMAPIVCDLALDLAWKTRTHLRNIILPKPISYSCILVT